MTYNKPENTRVRKERPHYFPSHSSLSLISHCLPTPPPDPATSLSFPQIPMPPTGAMLAFISMHHLSPPPTASLPSLTHPVSLCLRPLPPSPSLTHPVSLCLRPLSPSPSLTPPASFSIPQTPIPPHPSLRHPVSLPPSLRPLRLPPPVSSLSGPNASHQCNIYLCSTICITSLPLLPSPSTVCLPYPSEISFQILFLTKIDFENSKTAISI